MIPWFGYRKESQLFINRSLTRPLLKIPYRVKVTRHRTQQDLALILQGKQTNANWMRYGKIHWYLDAILSINPHLFFLSDRNCARECVVFFIFVYRPVCLDPSWDFVCWLKNTPGWVTDYCWTRNREEKDKNDFSFFRVNFAQCRKDLVY